MRQGRRNAAKRAAWSLALALAAAASSFDARADGAAGQGGNNPCEREILRAAGRHGVPAGILYSVGLAETGVKGSLRPYALNIAGKAVFAGSRAEAVRLAEEARLSGTRLVDVGCMQINRHFHGREFRSVSDMLDPRRNVDYAARFLARLHARHETWTMAVARYHAGPNNDPAQKRYVCRVIANLAATGFGRWTPDARAFCGTQAPLKRAGLNRGNR